MRIEILLKSLSFLHLFKHAFLILDGDRFELPKDKNMSPRAIPTRSANNANERRGGSKYPEQTKFLRLKITKIGYMIVSSLGYLFYGTTEPI